MSMGVAWHEHGCGMRMSMGVACHAAGLPLQRILHLGVPWGGAEIGIFRRRERQQGSDLVASLEP